VTSSPGEQRSTTRVELLEDELHPLSMAEPMTIVKIKISGRERGMAGNRSARRELAQRGRSFHTASFRTKGSSFFANIVTVHGERRP
jgi:hypothetical protein